MFTCHCPNCGKELAVPRWLPRTVTCENCHTKSIVPYDQDPDFNEYNAIAKSKVKLNDFRTAHPGFTKGIGIAGIVALAAGTFYLNLKEKAYDIQRRMENQRRKLDKMLTIGMNKKEIEALEKMLNKVLYNIAEP